MRKIILIAALVAVIGGVASVMAQQSQNPTFGSMGPMLRHGSVADGAAGDDEAGDDGQYAATPCGYDVRDSCTLQFAEQSATANPRDS